LGEDLLHTVRTVSNGIDDLTERDGQVVRWLSGNRDTVAGIYADEGVAGALPMATRIDLQESSHQDILEQLEGIVSGQLDGLRELMERTRAWDGLGQGKEIPFY